MQILEFNCTLYNLYCDMSIYIYIYSFYVERYNCPLIFIPFRLGRDSRVQAQGILWDE